MENTVTLLGVVFHEHLLYVAKESGGGISVVQRTLLISIDAGDCSSMILGFLLQEHNILKWIFCLRVTFPNQH